MADKKPKARTFTVSVNGWYGSPWRELTVTVVRDGSNEYGPTYAAFVGETPIGKIHKGKAMFERTTSTGVAWKRWHSLRFFAEQPYQWQSRGRLYQFPRETISGAVKLLAEEFCRFTEPVKD